MSGFISSASVEQVRAANDIVDVIGAVLPLKRAGANFVALCPFHKEKTPSFNVNPQKQIFHCFGCHKGGDVFRFIQDYENLTFVEAIRRLAERAKVPLESDDSGHAAHARSLKDALLDVHEQIAQRWQQALRTDAGAERARAYLAKRGVSGEAVELFRLGYAPEAWDDTVNWARSKRFDFALMEQSGLVIPKEGPGERRYYDRFRGRLMFPICDEQGRVIAFSGRVLGDEKTAKYVNSPETPIFTKGKVFYGLDKSKRALLDAQSAVICEGQLDLIACYMGGVRNVVAPQGTAFTADHARILRRYVEEVVLCFDSDIAGQTAAVRVLDSLVSSDLAVRVVVLPAPHDPDSYIKTHGGAAFSDLIQGAQGFFDFYLDHLCASNDPRSDKGQLAITRSMAAALHKTGSSVLLDRYAQKTALRLNVTQQAVRLEFKRTAGGRSALTDQGQESAAPDQAVARPPGPEAWLLKVLLLQDDLAEWLATFLNLAWIQHPGVREVVRRRLAAHRDQTWTGAAALVSELESEEERRLVSELLAEPRTVRNLQQQLSDIVLRLRNQTIDREMAGILRQLQSVGNGDAEHVRLLRRHEELRAKKSSALQPLPIG
jgi:DNA primase